MPFDQEPKKWIQQVVPPAVEFSEIVTRRFNHRGFWRLCFWISRLGKDIDLTYSRDGVRLALSVRDAYWLRLLAHGFRYEPELFNALARMRRWAPNLLDVGANIGFTAICALRRHGFHSVIAIEPNPRSAQRLVKNVKLNELESQVHLVQAAASASPGPLRLWVPVDESLHVAASLDSHLAQVYGHAIALDVETVSLERVLEAFHWDAASTVVKLDTEGNESELISSLDPERRKEMTLVFEEHGRNSANEATVRLMAQGDHALFYWSSSERSWCPLVAVDQLDSVKLSVHVGYLVVGIPNGRVRCFLAD